MSDKYNHPIAKVLGKWNNCKYFGITITEDCTLYNDRYGNIPNWLKRHEGQHKIQRRRTVERWQNRLGKFIGKIVGQLAFDLPYFWKNIITHGYIKNSYEVEARNAEGSHDA